MIPISNFHLVKCVINIHNVFFLVGGWQAHSYEMLPRSYRARNSFHSLDKREKNGSFFRVQKHFQTSARVYIVWENSKEAKKKRIQQNEQIKTVYMINDYQFFSVSLTCVGDCANAIDLNIYDRKHTHKR